MPGSRRPRRSTSSGSKLSVPVSEAQTTQPSRLCSQRQGRSPLRSRIAPTARPSLKAIAAGPSQGSISRPWKSMKPRSSGVGSRPAVASGTSIFSTWAIGRPVRTSSSTTASIVAESDWPSEISGSTVARSSPIRSERISRSRARIQLRLPVIVLTSPLWASTR